METQATTPTEEAMVAGTSPATHPTGATATWPDAEIAAITGSMYTSTGERNPEYWNSDQTQARLSQLLDEKQQRESPEMGRPAESVLHDYALGDLAGEPIVEDLAAVLEGFKVPAEWVNSILDSFGDDSNYAAADAEGRAETEAALRQAWGDEYEAKVKRVREYVNENLPAGISNLLLNARAGGHLLFNNAEIAAELAFHAERAPKVGPPTGDLDQDIAAIERAMSNDMDAYRRDIGLQVRLRGLNAQRMARDSQAQRT